MNIGLGSITAAELWGVFEGLSLAWDLGFKKIELKSDSRCAIVLLQQNGTSKHKHSHLVHAILSLLQQKWEVKLIHIYRESNFVADFMANYARELIIGSHRFKQPPLGLSMWLDYDRLGTETKRLVPSHCV